MTVLRAPSRRASGGVCCGCQLHHPAGLAAQRVCLDRRVAAERRHGLAARFRDRQRVALAARRQRDRQHRGGDPVDRCDQVLLVRVLRVAAPAGQHSAALISARDPVSIRPPPHAVRSACARCATGVAAICSSAATQLSRSAKDGAGAGLAPPQARSAQRKGKARTRRDATPSIRAAAADADLAAARGVQSCCSSRVHLGTDRRIVGHLAGGP
jgi:hypothetical protein